jgi:hypothetical protein
MRPIKDLISEEYWNIGFRKYDENDTVVSGGKQYTFNLLKANKRYWYADPFLFENKGRTYLFVEMFDNKTERGEIGCSEFIDGNFTQPRIVLSESFHLSYPYVFEKDGEIFMMPETHEDNCIETYRAVQFPDKWEKHKVLVENINAADSVFENGLLITAAVCPENDMSVDLCIYNGEGKQMSYSPAYSHSLTKRGAGRIFTYKGVRIRPAQSCENDVYGGKIIFNEIKECTDKGYCEEMFSQITPENILTPMNTAACGIHTYARTDAIEIVDIKFKRFNAKRLLWIFKNKLGV